MTNEDQEALAKTFGQAIRRRRLAADLTQEEVAEKLGVGNEAVSRLERGVASLSVTRLFELSELFGCEAAELLTEGNVRVDDQARQLQLLLSKLSGNDRELILQVVQQLGERLAR